LEKIQLKPLIQLLFSKFVEKNPKQSLLLILFNKYVVSAIFVTASFRVLLQQVPKNKIERLKISCSERKKSDFKKYKYLIIFFF